MCLNLRSISSLLRWVKGLYGTAIVIGPGVKVVCEEVIMVLWGGVEGL